MNPFVAGVRLASSIALTALVALPCLLLGLLERAGLHKLGKRTLAELQSFWARWMLKVLAIELDVVSPPHRGVSIVSSNHLSHIDILVVSAVFPSRFVAKSEIQKWPVIGWLASMAGTLFVRRGDRKDVPRVVREIRATLDAGVSVTFFPEGWASRGLRVKRFHPGLFEAAASGGFECLPVSLSYSTPDGTYAPAWTVAWWGPVPISRHVWRMLRNGPVRALVAFPAETIRRSDRKALAVELQAMTQALFVPLRQAPVPPPIQGDPSPEEDRDVVDA